VGLALFNGPYPLKPWEWPISGYAGAGRDLGLLHVYPSRPQPSAAALLPLDGVRAARLPADVPDPDLTGRPPTNGRPVPPREGVGKGLELPARTPSPPGGGNQDPHYLWVNSRLPPLLVPPPPRLSSRWRGDHCGSGVSQEGRHPSRK